MDAPMCLDFIAAFQELATRARTSNEVNLESFRNLLSAVGVENLGAGGQREMDVFFVALGLLNAHAEAEAIRKLGKKLMFSLSAVGNAIATAQILHHALLQAGHLQRPEVLRAAEIIRPRGHLQKLARQGRDCAALTLEAKIALVLGDEEYGLSCLQEALPLAIQVAEMQEAYTGKLDERARRAQLRDMDELFTPWVELYRLHVDRYERRSALLKQLSERATTDQDRVMVSRERRAARDELRKAEEYIQIGLLRDDPFSMLHGASFCTEHGADWLYYMNKAAASGMVRAMDALAKFYSESMWKYLKDEPPADVKPTAFDSYPERGLTAPSLVTRISASLVSFYRYMLSKKTTNAEQNTPKALHGKENIFYTAAWPCTAEERFRLALEWAEVAAGHTYVPSALTAAKLYLTPNLPLGLDAPKNALALDPSRYDFKDQESYKARAQRKGLEDVEGVEHNAPPSETPRRNPWYNEDKARHHIREIFFAAKAIDLRNELVRTKGGLPKSSFRSNFAQALDRDDGRLDHFQAEPETLKYLKQPSIREQYEDKESMERLVADAREICDKRGWQIRDTDDGLLYQPISK